jgi:hypothetical protein
MYIINTFAMLCTLMLSNAICKLCNANTNDFCCSDWKAYRKSLSAQLLYVTVKHALNHNM